MMTQEQINKKAVELTFNYRRDQEVICLMDQILNIQAMLTLISADQLAVLKVMMNLSCADGLDHEYKNTIVSMIDKALKGELD